MENERSRQQWLSILAFAVLVALVIWLSVFSRPSKKLRIVACDVGQGDALIIIHQSTQIVVDGGPGDKILSCLERYLPFWDRQIEMVVLTHPQADHLNGLVDVYDRYTVDNFVTTPVANSTSGFRLLKEAVENNGSQVILAEDGKKINMGLIYLDILNPISAVYDQNYIDDTSVLGAMITSEDLNNFSIVFNLHYYNFDALFTGDLGPEKIHQMIARDGIKDVEYLKIPHHGSRNGLTQELLDASTPEIAVMSLAADNRYGHPHQEIIEMLQKSGIDYYRTDESGDVIVESDGNMFWIVK